MRIKNSLKIRTYDLSFYLLHSLKYVLLRLVLLMLRTANALQPKRTSPLRKWMTPNKQRICSSFIFINRTSRNKRESRTFYPSNMMSAIFICSEYDQFCALCPKWTSLAGKDLIMIITSQSWTFFKTFWVLKIKIIVYIVHSRESFYCKELRISNGQIVEFMCGFS